MSAFRRKNEEADFSVFRENPFSPLEEKEETVPKDASGEEAAPEDDSPAEKAGEITGWVLMGIILGSLAGVIVKMALDAWF